MKKLLKLILLLVVLALIAGIVYVATYMLSLPDDTDEGKMLVKQSWISEDEKFTLQLGKSSTFSVTEDTGDGAEIVMRGVYKLHPDENRMELLCDPFHMDLPDDWAVSKHSSIYYELDAPKNDKDVLKLVINFGTNAKPAQITFVPGKEE
ncbi:MAG: hypothetical protein QM689_11430 [Oscillospiraceae bacterium]